MGAVTGHGHSIHGFHFHRLTLAGEPLIVVVLSTLGMEGEHIQMAEATGSLPREQWTPKWAYSLFDAFGLHCDSIAPLSHILPSLLLTGIWTSANLPSCHPRSGLTAVLRLAVERQTVGLSLARATKEYL